MEIKQIKVILDKIIDNTATEEEIKIISTLLDSEEGQRVLEEQMEEDLQQIEAEADPVRNREIIERAYLRITNRIRTKRWQRYIIKAVAVILPFILIGMAVIWIDTQIHIFTPVDYAELKVEKGEHLQFVLQDGTHVWLKGGSTLSYPIEYKWNERKVKFQGEGFFEVHHDSKKPFYIETQNGLIKVLGTKFNVSSYKEDSLTVLTLIEGSISFTTQGKDYLLSPGENLSYNNKTGIVTIDNSKNIDKILKRKDQILTFDRAPLSEVLITLSRWYGKEFEIQDERAKDITFTYNCGDQSLAIILNDLEMISPLVFKNEGEKIEIFIKE